MNPRFKTLIPRSDSLFALHLLCPEGNEGCCALQKLGFLTAASRNAQVHGAWEKDEMGDFNVPRGRLDYMWEIVGSHESGIWSPAATPLTLFLTPPCLITFAGRRGSDAVIKPDLLSGQNSTRLPIEKKPLELYCTNFKQSIGENFHPHRFPRNLGSLRHI